MAKEKVSTMKHPDPTSKRSERRAKRGFKELEVSSRKHRRAARRSMEVREISGVFYPAGEKHELNARLGNKLSSWLHTAGGSTKYHKA